MPGPVEQGSDRRGFIRAGVGVAALGAVGLPFVQAGPAAAVAAAAAAASSTTATPAAENAAAGGGGGGKPITLQRNRVQPS